MTETVSFEAVNPKSLSDADIHTIYRIEQDMWARNEGLGEYVHCSSCSKTFGKQDIYDKSDISIYSSTVYEIEKKIGFPSCPDCSDNLEHVFSEDDYIPEIIKRYSGRAHLVLVKSDLEIVGFMDGHISDFDTIFDRDFSYRYSERNKEEIRRIIEEFVDGDIPESMFSCSSMGTKENYMFFHNIYRLLQAFFSSFPKEHEKKVGISELNIGGSLEKLYSHLGAQKADMGKISDIDCSENYKSGIFLQNQLGATYKQGFSKDLRTFLRERAI